MSHGETFHIFPTSVCVRLANKLLNISFSQPTSKCWRPSVSVFIDCLYVQYHCLHFKSRILLNIVMADPAFSTEAGAELTDTTPWLCTYCQPQRSSSLYSTPYCVLQTLACQAAPRAGRNLDHSRAQSCGQISACSYFQSQPLCLVLNSNMHHYLILKQIVCVCDP